MDQKDKFFWTPELVERLLGTKESFLIRKDLTCPSPYIQLRPPTRRYPRLYLLPLATYLRRSRHRSGFNLREMSWRFWESYGDVLLERIIEKFNESVSSQPMYTYVQVASMLNMSTKTIQRYAAQGVFGEGRAVSASTLLEVVEWHTPER